MNIDLRLGDCLEVMATLPENSIDTIITDPPYGLEFMGKDWDKGVPGVAFWREALRVAKPGAMLLAMGGTRTFHRLVVAIEDAGFEIRDTIAWVYGSGFPKSHDISKSIGRVAKKGWDDLGKAIDNIQTDDIIQVWNRAESPVYMGGLIKEIVFQEVVSNASSDANSNQPLGTLAGKGVMGDTHKGGDVYIKVDEPSYIIGVVSLTPRVGLS